MSPTLKLIEIVVLVLFSLIRFRLLHVALIYKVMIENDHCLAAQHPDMFESGVTESGATHCDRREGRCRAGQFVFFLNALIEHFEA